MLDWLRDQFNSWFGSNETHVANAYSGSDHIVLLFQSERLTTDQISATIKFLNGTNDSEVKILVIKKIEKQLVRVPFNQVHKQRRRTAYEFLTVFAENRESAICENYRIPANRSYIITNEGGIKDYDKTNH